MKRFLFITAVAALGNYATVYAQTPQNKKHTVVFDFSDTWCGPCGQYGVAIADTVDHKLSDGDKGYLIGIKGSFNPSSPSTINAIGAGAMFGNFNLQGVPTFMVNNIEAQAPTGNNANDIVGIMAASATFNASPFVASTAGNMSISGNTLTVNAKTKFWSAATGDYYMTAFLTEDKIVAAQNMNSANTVHPHVLKGAMASSGTALATTPWGEQVGTSTIAINAEFSKTYTVSIDAAWKKENLEVYILLFKKNGTKYEFINAEKAKLSGTGIGATNFTALQSASVYPNPTGGDARLELALAERLDIKVSITDISGRAIYTAAQNLNAGKHTLSLPSGQFANGVYDVTISADGKGAVSKKLIVRK